jgi:uncharacterized small protein (DUF1192 family)
MDMDELFARRPDDPLIQLMRQDLDPLSVAELEERMTILKAEIDRIDQKRQKAVNHKLNADALFKR